MPDQNNTGPQIERDNCDTFIETLYVTENHFAELANEYFYSSA